MQALDIRDLEIERRLDAFARARLSPDPQVVARTRARVMREARLQHEAARIAAHVAPAVALAARRSTLRRVVTPLLAASLWLGIAVGSIAAAQAGGPLYPTRLWIEQATLPAAGSERMAAEVARMDARLADALTGAAHGDSGAVAAALRAYDEIASETLSAAAGNAELEALVASALDRHRAVLTAVIESLDAKGNTTAANAVEAAIQQAIVHNAAVIERIGSGKPSSTTGGGGNGSPAGDGTGAGTGTSTGTGSSIGGSGGSASDGSGATASDSGGPTSGSQGRSGDGDSDGTKAGHAPKPTPPSTPTPQPTPTRDRNDTPRGRQ